LDRIKSSLVDIQRAIKGEVVMSAELEAVGQALFDNRIPAFWAARSYPSIKPLASYIVDFVERLKFIDSWIENGKPANYWISGFYFTQSFFTGVK
jgi:dynein heavy chain